MEMHQMGQVVMKKKTCVLKASGGQCQWKETFHFLLTALDHNCSLLVKLYSRSSMRRKQCLGQVSCCWRCRPPLQTQACSEERFKEVLRAEEVISFPMFLAGSAGVWQPHPRGSGTVEGHNGSPGESGGRVAQDKPSLKLSAQLLHDWRAAGPAVRSCFNSQLSRISSAVWVDSDGPPSGLLNGAGPGRHFRLSVVNKGLEQNVGAGRRFSSFLCR